MNRKKLTIDAQDAQGRFKSRLEEVNGERQEILEEFKQYKSDNKDVPDEMRDDWEALEAERVQLERKVERFDDFISEVSSTEFVISELTFGQMQAVKDIVSQESFDVDVQKQSVEGTPLEGVYREAILTRSIQEKPEEVDNVMDLPDVIGEWLWGKVDALNTSGDEEMGNMSLEEALESES